VIEPIMTPAAHKALVNIAHFPKEINAFLLAVRREREEHRLARKIGPL